MKIKLCLHIVQRQFHKITINSNTKMQKAFQILSTNILTHYAREHTLSTVVLFCQSDLYINGSTSAQSQRS